MTRAEFDKPTKRAALKRAGDGNVANAKCEAIGEWYGLDPGQRCNMPLANGVEFDHVILEANSHDNSLANCAAVCIPCHRHKTRKLDIPTAAKTLRQQDKNSGIRSRSNSMPCGRNSPLKKKMDGSVVRRT